MARPRKKPEDLHQNEIKVRLTDSQTQFVESEAARRDVPVAIVLRELIVLGQSIIRQQQAA
jgi:hypothetical protein